VRPLIARKDFVKILLVGGGRDRHLRSTLKAAGLQRGRAGLANKIREQVYLAAFGYNEADREFQFPKETAKQGVARIRLPEVE
jgi:hypothetical protein